MPQICEVLGFCDFFVVLSCPGYTFFSSSHPARTPGRILTIYSSNDASSHKDVPSGGFDDDPTTTTTTTITTTHGTLFTVLSSWHGYCRNSPSTFDEWRSAVSIYYIYAIKSGYYRNSLQQQWFTVATKVVPPVHGMRPSSVTDFVSSSRTSLRRSQTQ